MDTDALIASLSENTAPVRVNAPLARGLALRIVATVLYIVLLLVLNGTRPDLLSKLTQPLFAAEISTLTLVVLTSLLSAILYAAPDLRQKPLLARAPFATFALFLLVIAYAFFTQPADVAAPAHEMECTICITLFALVPALALFTGIRRQATTHAGAAGCIALLAAFSIGALALRLHEPTDSLTHIVTFHYLPMFAACLIGIGLGKKLLKW